MSHIAVDLMSRYIRLDTSNPPGNEKIAVEFFGNILNDAQIPFKTYESEPGRTSIRAAIKGTGKKPPVIMMHHMDVIAANKDEWSFDPFGGEIIDGYICGRGTLDTKSLGIMQLLALLDVKKKGIKLDCDLVFLAAADEECRGTYGVGYLLSKHLNDFKCGVLLNEGGYVVSGVIPGVVMALISSGEKGPCWFKLKRKGISGHGSTPHNQNALQKMIAALNKLANYQLPHRLTPIVREYFKKMAVGLDFLKPYADDGKDEILLKILKDTGMLYTPQINAMLHNTISIDALHSGTKVNVIPSYAEAEVDTRLLPGQDIDEWIGFIKEQLADDEIEIELTTRAGGNASDTNTEYYRMIEMTFQEHYPGAIAAPYLMQGTTDSLYFRAMGMTAYGFCPAEVPFDHIKSVHGVDEKIAVESMIKGTETYIDIATRLCTKI